MTVTELTARIKECLEGTFRLVRVEGEVSNHRVYPSGHRYFSLKDGGAQIRVVLFKTRERFIFGELRDGQTAVVTGPLGVYEKRGEYQVYAQSVEIGGLGGMLVELEKRKARLAAEGLFDAARKRPLPAFPRRIGLVTSRQGAALRDMIRVARGRWPAVGITLAPALVQGEGAAADIAGAVAALSAEEGVDVLIVGRGGGSAEDLFAFNEEAVVRAIAASPIPTISAVGHETDFTLSDLAADHRAPTPTAAAQMAVPERLDWAEKVAGLVARAMKAQVRIRETARQELRHAARALSDPRPLLMGRRYSVAEMTNDIVLKARGRIREARTGIAALDASLRRHSPGAWVGRKRGETAVLGERARGRTAARAAELRAALDVLSGKLDALDPRRVLLRGYAIAARRASGEAVRSVAEVSAGDLLDIRVADGAFGAVAGEPKE